MGTITGLENLQQGQTISKSRLEALLDKQAPQSGTPSSSLYLRPGDPEAFWETLGTGGKDWREHFQSLSRAVTNSDTGIVGLQAGHEALVIVPPFPLDNSAIIPRWDPSPLKDLLNNELTVGVVLVRLGRFAVAVYHGHRLLSSKTDTRYVKGRHSAGGTSQKRYSRIREGQVHRLYGKACGAVEGVFAEYSGQLDYVLMGGDKGTIDGFLKECPYLEQFSGRFLGRRLNVREPKHDTLGRVGSMLTESRVWAIEW